MKKSKSKSVYSKLKCQTPLLLINYAAVEFYFVELQNFIILLIIRKNDSRRIIHKTRVKVDEKEIKYTYLMSSVGRHMQVECLPLQLCKFPLASDNTLDWYHPFSRLLQH